MMQRDYLTIASPTAEGRSRSLSASDLSKISSAYTTLLKPPVLPKSSSHNSVWINTYENCEQVEHPEQLKAQKEHSQESQASNGWAQGSGIDDLVAKEQVPDLEHNVDQDRIQNVVDADCAVHDTAGLVTNSLGAELTQLKIIPGVEPVKPPRPKKANIKLPANRDHNHSPSESNLKSISQNDNALLRSDSDSEAASETQRPRPVPRPKPRLSLIKAAMEKTSGGENDISSKMTRTASYEKALEVVETEQLLVSKAEEIEHSKLDDCALQNSESDCESSNFRPVTLTRSLSRSAGNLVNINDQACMASTDSDLAVAESKSQQECPIKPLRPAPPPPGPKPSQTKILAVSLSNSLSDVASGLGFHKPQASQPGVIEQNERRNSTSTAQSAKPPESNGFQLFPVPNFLKRTESANKSNKSSKFYVTPQQQDFVMKTGIAPSNSVPGSLDRVTREQSVSNEDDFAMLEDNSLCTVPSSRCARTSRLSSSSSNVSDLSRSESDVFRDSSLRHSSRSSLSFGSAELPSPSLNFDEMDEDSKQKLMDEMRRKAFCVAKEITESEQAFVEVLQLLNEDFRRAVESAKDDAGRPVLANGVLNQIIRYLPQLQLINKDLLKDLQARINNWSVTPKIADVFVRKGAFLKMYTEYIRDFESMVALLDDNRQKNLAFDKVVNTFENGPQCKKLAVRHYMLKPIQRIPQYRLLLRDYLKHLMPDSPDYQDTQAALVIVSEVAEHANHNMKYLETVKHLQEIQNSLIGQFEVIQPGRILIKEGVLNKLSRKEMQPRMFFLFNDALLYTTPVGSGYKLNNILPLNKMRVSKPTKEDFQNEFSILTTQRSFTISARTEQERTEWLTALEQAITEALQKRLSYNPSQPNRQVIQVEVDMKNLRVGMVAPVWIPDDRVSMCMLCQNMFTLSFRRHHCRGCGKVVCKSCSDYKAPLRYLDYRPDRVCLECFETLEKAVSKMSFQEIVKNSNEQVFGRDDLRAMFRGYPLLRSKSMLKPAKLSEVSANAKEVDASGYLRIWKNRSWKKMWFVIKDNVLYTYKASEDSAAEESMPLLGYDVLQFNTTFQGVETNVLFELNHRGLPSIIFRTENEQSRERWMNAMRLATVA